MDGEERTNDLATYIVCTHARKWHKRQQKKHIRPARHVVATHNILLIIALVHTNRQILPSASRPLDQPLMASRSLGFGLGADITTTSGDIQKQKAGISSPHVHKQIAVFKSAPGPFKHLQSDMILHLRNVGT